MVLASLSVEQQHEFTHREYRIRRPNGAIRWVRADSFPVRNEAGAVTRVVVVAEDFTERKHAELARDLAEAALRDSENRYASFFRCSPAAIAVSCPSTGQYIEVNPAFEQYTGYRRDQVIGHTAGELNLWVDLSQRDRLLRQVQKQGSVTNFEFQLRRKDGEIRTVLMTAECYEIDGYNYLMTVGVDITDRKQAEAALQASEARYRKLVDNVPNTVVSTLDRNLRITFSSGQALQDIGFTSDFLVNKPVFEAASREAYPQLDQMLHRALAGESGRVEMTYVEKDWLVNVAPLLGAADQVEELLIISHNISDLKALQGELKRQRDFRELLFNESNDALFLVDLDTLHTVDCNQRAVELFEANHKADLIGFAGHLLQKQPFTPEELEAITQQIAQQGFWSMELEYVTCKGRVFWGDLSARQITFGNQRFNLARVTDISDRKAAEFALQQQAQREQTLNRVTQAIRQSLDLDAIFSTATQEIAQLLGADQANVVQFFPDRGYWQIVASHHTRRDLPDVRGVANSGC